jgi:hypothetical protein
MTTYRVLIIYPISARDRQRVVRVRADDIVQAAKLAKAKLRNPEYVDAIESVGGKSNKTRAGLEHLLGY